MLSKVSLNGQCAVRTKRKTYSGSECALSEGGGRRLAPWPPAAEKEGEGEGEDERILQCASPRVTEMQFGLYDGPWHFSHSSRYQATSVDPS